jgi:pimeloyl-ACP methyl ester carboxylesterase
LRVRRGARYKERVRGRVLFGAGAAVSAAALVGVALGARPAGGEGLESPLGGSEGRFAWRGHRVFYVTRGGGPRAVLVHALHAAASAFEWRRNFTPLAAFADVFALDLLGFGKSDRPPVRYTARLYVDLLADFLREVAGGPAVLVASGRSGAYAVQVAGEAPDLVTGLVLVGHVGASRPPTAPWRAVEMLLRSDLLGEAAFAALVSRPGLGYALRRRGYADPAAAAREAVDYHYRTSHQPGARFAPAALLGRALDLDAGGAFAGLRRPVVLVCGARGPDGALEQAGRLRRLNPAATLHVIEGAGALAHEERPESFNDIVRGAVEGWCPQGAQPAGAAGAAGQAGPREVARARAEGR